MKIGFCSSNKLKIQHNINIYLIYIYILLWYVTREPSRTERDQKELKSEFLFDVYKLFTSLYT